jgi:hypothetical protein
LGGKKVSKYIVKLEIIEDRFPGNDHTRGSFTVESKYNSKEIANRIYELIKEENGL